MTGDEPAGKVLVLSSAGYPDASLGGGTKLSRLDHHGLAGLLADGRLRDFDQLRDYRFSTWCRGEATRPCSQATSENGPVREGASP